MMISKIKKNSHVNRPVQESLLQYSVALLHLYGNLVPNIMRNSVVAFIHCCRLTSAVRHFSFFHFGTYSSVWARK